MARAEARLDVRDPHDDVARRGPNGPTWLCDAIHARATKIITNFHAACELCAESETVESIIESARADVFFFDAGFFFLGAGLAADAFFFFDAATASSSASTL